MKVGTVGTARVAAEPDDVAGLDCLSRVDQTAGEVGVVSLQPVVMPDDHQVAVPAGVSRTFGDAHHAVPRGRDRRALGIAEIDAAVHPAMAESIIRSDAVVGRMVIARKNDGIASSGTLVTVVDGHNVEVLIQVIARHPVEVGEQHPVAVVDIVQIGIIHRVDEVAQRVILNDRLYARSVVHHIELYVVLLRRKPSGKRHEKQHQSYISLEIRLSHGLPFYFLAVVTFAR